MSMAVSRARCPIVYIAYGAGGDMWLRDIRTRCREFEATRALVDYGALLFWWVGARGDAPEGIGAWPRVPTLKEVSELLSTARGSELDMLLPGFEQRRVITVERANLFVEDLASLRRDLHALLNEVPGSKTMARHGEQYFDYQRFFMADAIHEPTSVSNAQRASARDALTATGTDASTVFLVDRENTNVAVITERLAHHSLMELAGAFAFSDLGAPLQVGATTQLPEPLRTPSTTTVIPFSLMVVEHRWREIEEARTRSFREQLATVVMEGADAGRTIPLRTPLRKAVEDDVAAIDRGAYDPHERRRRRLDEIKEYLEWALTGVNSQTALDIITDAKRTADQLIADTSASVSARRDQWMLALPVAIQDSLRTGADGSASGAAPLHPAFLVAAASAVAAWLFVYLRRRRAGLEGKEAALAPSESIALERAALRDEWRRACTRLETIITSWDELCQRVRHQAGVRRDANSYVWNLMPPNRAQLTSALGIPDQLFGDPIALCRRLAASCVQQLETSDTADSVLERAAKEAMRGLVVGGVDLSVAAEYLKEAVGHEHAQRLRTAFSQAPWLINPTRPVQREAIIWLVHPDLDGQATFAPLESAASAPSTMWRTHDDGECSVRLQIGTPIPVDTISSLKDRDR